MKKTMVLISSALFFIVSIQAGLIFAEVSNKEDLEVAESNSDEPQVQWLWGEVVSVDIKSRALLVRCLDYETDSEKEMNMAVDDTTTYENVGSINDIKAQETVSIDYIVGSGGKAIAKNISLEKPEPSPATKADISEGVLGNSEPDNQ